MSSITDRLGNLIALLGFLAFLGSGLTMIALWVITFTGWLGWLGILVGLVSAPAAVLFPFVYWIIEHAFPVDYFLVWLAGVLGVVLSMGWVGMATEPAPVPISQAIPDDI